MNELFGLRDQDRQKICAVFENFSLVNEVVIYGSRAKGNYRVASDIDLTIMDPIDWRTFTALEAELDDLLLPYQIDLSIFSHIDNPDLIEHIRKIGKKFYVRG